MKNQIIRQLTTLDAKSYQNLRIASLKTDPISFLSIFDTEKSYPNDYFAKKIHYSQNGKLGYWGLFENGKLIATVQIADSGVYKKRHIVGLYELYVDPTARRSGVATKLVSHVIKTASEIPGVEQIQLKVNSKNTGAISFYEKLGFVKVATIPNSVKEEGGSYQDELIYCLHLKKN